MEYFADSATGKKVREYVESSDERLVSAINLAEVYTHILARRGPEQAEKHLRFMVMTSFVVPVGIDIAVLAAKLKHEKKMGMADAIVMATASLHQAKIVTGDPDFKNEPNVIYLGK
jgi:predicted nucleic acid-binding protein